MNHATCSLVLVSALIAAGATSAFGQIVYDSVTVPGGPSTVTGISGSDVVGQYVGSSDSFFYDGTNVTTIADPNATGDTDALGIYGTTVVGSYTANNRDYGFVESGGSYSTINVPQSVDTQVAGIAGSTIVGTYTSASGAEDGFFESGGNFTTLSVPGSFGTQATGISGGTIIGTYKTATGEQGFMYQNGTYVTLADPLGTEGTVPTGMSGNTVVGYYYVSDGPQSPYDAHGFIWNGSTFQTMDDPSAGRNAYGVMATYPTAIWNNTIVGSYSAPGATFTSGFVATTNATPEPRAVALALLAAGLFVLLRRRYVPRA